MRVLVPPVALVAVAVAVAVAGCGVHRCKPGTLLVSVELVGAAASADALLVDVKSGDDSPARTRLAHRPGAADGTIEIEFPGGYPVGQPVTVSVTALQSGATVAQAMSVALLGAGCDTTSISVGDVDVGGNGGLSSDGSACGTTGCPALLLPTDPEFKDASAWKLAGGAVIDPTAPGLEDVGELVLGRQAACGGGSARQSLTIPTFDEAGALALTHTVQRTCAATGHDCVGGSVGVRFGDGVIAIPATATLMKSTTCLGARAYGATVDLAVSDGDSNDCNDPALSALELRVDRLAISPAPSCPPPGVVADGNFDGDANAWTLQLANGTATIDAGIGVGGSRAGHITTSQLCQAPKLRGLQSVPVGAQVALSLLVKGTAGKAALVGEEANLARWAALVGTGVFETPRVCVPEYAKGMVLPILLSTETPAGACSTLDMRDFVFDDLTFVVEPSCPMTTYVIDPGFERYAAVPQWNLATDVGSGASAGVTATVTSDAGQAHTGTHALKLAASQLCTSARANTAITVPAGTATAGPALKFWYRAPSLTNTSAAATVPGATLKLAPAISWKQATLCLDPARTGQGVHFEVSLTAAGVCGRGITEETAQFDDFEATTDASCPTR
jgi:hypothetical protein